MACSIGPVLAEADAVASKVATVFSRGYARDHLDLAGILASGRNSRDQLMAMAKAVDAGFTTGWFAERLPHLLTIDQLVERLGTSTRHIRRLIAERRIPDLTVNEHAPDPPIRRDGDLRPVVQPTNRCAVIAATCHDSR